MNATHFPRDLPPQQPLDVAMHALYSIARFVRSGARIGMSGPDVATYVGEIARCAAIFVEAKELEASNGQHERIETMHSDIAAMQDIATELQARGMSDLSQRVLALATTLDRDLARVRDFAISECIGVCLQAANSFGPAAYHSSFFEGRVAQAKLCAETMQGLLEEPQ